MDKAYRRQRKIRVYSYILRTSAEYVKPGGILVYSTRTIEPDENIEIVREFVNQIINFI